MKHASAEALQQLAPLIEQLQSEFLLLAKQLYSAAETPARRRNFKQRPRTSPNFRRHSHEQLIAA